METAASVFSLLKDARKPWWVAGGWAIDLYLDNQTRTHGDIEIAIARSDQGYFRALLEPWSFAKCDPDRDGLQLPWKEGEYLEPPIHEIHACSKGTELREFEILLNEFSGDCWRFRRDRSITMPVAQLSCKTEEGIPFFAPEVVLLYKAKATQEKDRRDFLSVVGSLDRKRRQWLKVSLEKCHPDHEWIEWL